MGARIAAAGGVGGAALLRAGNQSAPWGLAHPAASSQTD